VLEAPNVADTTEYGYLTYDREDTDDTGRFFRELYLDVLDEPIATLAVTNSVLCLPAAKKGRKNKQGRETTSYPVTPPLRKNCSEHLRAQVESLDPLIVVTLGRPALLATQRIEDHGQEVMREAVGIPRPWFNRTLLPLYHPGLQARNSPLYGRSPDKQRRDWLGLRELLASERAAAQR
jgi:uracil-DNA glycosylase